MMLPTIPAPTADISAMTSLTADTLGGPACTILAQSGHSVLSRTAKYIESIGRLQTTQLRPPPAGMSGFTGSTV